MDDLGNMSTCRMHDLMHDLVDSMGGEKIMRSSDSICLENISLTTCHLAITGDRNDGSREDYYGDHEPGNPCKVRTLICLKNLSNKELKQICRNFLRLRVLVIIEGSNSECNASSLDASLILSSVHKLKHLRYLGLGGSGGEKIPNSVATLVNMQVLKLVDFWRLKELPRDIKTLVNLKHLELDSEYVVLNHVPKGIGELKFLQTLSTFVVGKTVGAGLDELKGLNALSGKLTIEGLAHANTPREGVYVLKEKLYLQSLVLDWGRDCDRDVDGVTLLSTRDEGMLEMLWPHSNLKSLMIRGGGVYQGAKLPNWLSGLTSLVEFSLIDCKRFEYLPQLHQMFSLIKLTIQNCPLLKGIKEEDDNWPRFHCLSSLCIKGCPMLTRLPTFPTLEGELQLDNVSLAPFARTIKMKMRRALIHPLSNLTKLALSDMDDDLESLSHHDFKNCLISIQDLTIEQCGRGVKLPGSLCSSIYLIDIALFRCKMVEYLPPLHELPSLKMLTIADCPNLKGCWWKKQQATEEDWPHFLRLSYLSIRCCPKLTRIPLFPTLEGGLLLEKTSGQALVRTMKMKRTALVAPLSKLKEMIIAGIDDLESLPEEGICNLTSLQEFVIWECPRLASLPPAMRHLTSLPSLRVNDCEKLTERCKEEDWPNISHIPYILLNYKELQNLGTEVFLFSSAIYYAIQSLLTKLSFFPPSCMDRRATMIEAARCYALPLL
ncbi:unnamed protein product [Linum tenue]|uniref:R13L1/DRL21-like LRR repeat region domain-containing protein n=1 Tax=Linum tenue TaxID=586396 RepID=A0AAV0L3B1_9ROSI|nr:unnamed protein product [Linum tenue]